MVTGGRAGEAGPLGMKRELRAIDAEIMQLEHQMEEMQASLETVNAEIQASEQSLEEISAQQLDAERNLFAAITATSKLRVNSRVLASS